MLTKIIIILVGVLVSFGLAFFVSKMAKRAPVSNKNKKKIRTLNFNKILLVLVGIFVVLGLVYVLQSGSVSTKTAFSQQTAQQGDQRVAVFLTNGQVYFGYLANADKDYVVLNDIYYLNGQDLLNPDKTDSVDLKKVSLIKMSNELHQPQSTMNISSNQILFFQKLRPDSRINLAINKFNANTNTP
jgi:hypothetical protein